MRQSLPSEWRSDSATLLRETGYQLNTCIKEAQRERVVITRNGKPIALIIGLEGMDEEQLQLGSSDKFWRLIAERRTQKTISRAELEQNINSTG